MILQPWAMAALALIGGYLLGSIPFGIVLTRTFGVGDLRQIGSGNIGATNVLRTGHKGLAAATLLLDGAKGAAAVLVAGLFGRELMLVAGAGAFMGHLYPLWLRFNGGKGVATLLGLAFALHWPCGAIALGMWLAAALVTRYSSVGGMAAAVTLPLTAAIYGDFPLVLLFLFCAVLLLWKHRGNLERLLAGVEPRIGAPKVG